MEGFSPKLTWPEADVGSRFAVSRRMPNRQDGVGACGRAEALALALTVRSRRLIHGEPPLTGAVTTELTFALAAAGLLLGGLLWLNRYGSLPAYRDGSGRTVPGSVSEVRALTLGGYRQWVTLRGPSARAPILVWLSGGPGLDESFMLRRFNGDLEQRYLVAYWVQRGAGRSFDRRLDPASLTIDQFVSDLDELVTYLGRRFGERKVVLVGHSWGTVVGVEYAALHPEKVAAYIGIGQVTDMPENERRGYDFAMAEATRHHDRKAVGVLRRVGPPPYSVTAMLAQRKVVAAYGGAFHQPLSMARMIWWSLETSRGAWLDLLRFLPAQSLSLRSLWPELSRLELSVTRPELEVPVAIFAGRYDRQVSAELAYRFFERLKAPRKHFEWFEQSAHSPQFEEPARFNAALVDTLDRLLSPTAPRA